MPNQTLGDVCCIYIIFCDCSWTFSRDLRGMIHLVDWFEHQPGRLGSLGTLDVEHSEWHMEQASPLAEPQRRLTNLLNCMPPEGPSGLSEKLKVAFSNTLEEHLCDYQEPKVDNSEMRRQCDQFCQPKGISLLIGSPEYGFNMAEAEEVCLPTEGVLNHDPAQLELCGQWSQGFQEVEIATMEFIAQLEVFNAVRLEHAAAMVQDTLRIQEYVNSTAFRELVGIKVDKVTEVVKAVKSRLEGGNATLSDSRLKAEISSLKLRTEALKAALDKNMKLIQQFLEQCNTLYVGTGPQKEYLLDICSVLNDGCLEHASAGHVTCCCAYHPFTAFGEQLPSSIISGIGDFPSPARVAPGRRLRRMATEVPTDICAAAWVEASPKVSEARLVGLKRESMWKPLWRVTAFFLESSECVRKDLWWKPFPIQLIVFYHPLANLLYGVGISCFLPQLFRRGLSPYWKPWREGCDWRLQEDHGQHLWQWLLWFSGGTGLRHLSFVTDHFWFPRLVKACHVGRVQFST